MKLLIYALLVILACLFLWASIKRPCSLTEKIVYCHDVCSGSIPDWQGTYKKQCIGKLILDDCSVIR